MDNQDNLKLNAKDKPLGELIFSTSKYKIPRYQRPYAWEEDHIADFWNDLLNSATFIGSFVLNNESVKETKYIEIIDGQQRLLTITIFMAVLRDIARALGDDESAKRIQRQCIAFEDKRGKQAYRILCGESTNEFFEKFIQQMDNDIQYSSPGTKEEKRIKNNYLFLKKKVLDDLEDIDGKARKIERIIDLWDRVSEIKVISIEIESEDVAYEIFETVNARGLELSVSDLLKNLIFEKIKIKDPNKDIVKNKWSEIEANINDTGMEMKKFLRYFWLSKYSFITEKKLFKEIKKEVKDYERFLEELRLSSNLYNQLIDLDQEFWQSFKDGSKMFNALLGLNTIGVSQCYVLFLSILRNYDKLGTNPRSIFELIEKFSFVYATICNLPGNKVEKIYSRYAINIERIVRESKSKDINKRIQTLFAELQKELRQIKPGFEQFNDGFRELEYKNSDKRRRLLKYILSKINSIYESGEYKIDFNKVDIEHLLPQKPGKGWNVKFQDIKEYVHNIGNLTLIHHMINKSAGNKSLKDKIIRLKDSKISLTKELIKKVEESDLKWDETQIFKRNAELGKIAFNKIWDF